MIVLPFDERMWERDIPHIGRHGMAPEHSQECRSSCARTAVHDREYRRFEGVW